MPEDEAEDNLSRPRPRLRTKFRPRGQSGLEDLTSLNPPDPDIFVFPLFLYASLRFDKLLINEIDDDDELPTACCATCCPTNLQ